MVAVRSHSERVLGCWTRTGLVIFRRMSASPPVDFSLCDVTLSSCDGVDVLGRPVGTETGDQTVVVEGDHIDRFDGDHLVRGRGDHPEMERGGVAGQGRVSNSAEFSAAVTRE